MNEAETVIEELMRRDAPCDKYQCEKRHDCATQLLACSSFRWFVKSGKSLTPFMYIPARVTRKDQPEFRDEIEATREIFVSIQEDDE